MLAAMVLILCYDLPFDDLLLPPNGDVMGVFDYIWLGILAVFQGPSAFSLFGLSISITILMVLAGFLLGILVGATPGLAGPMAMAISLPVLISTFGFNADALLPVMGFLIGIMKAQLWAGRCLPFCSIHRERPTRI